MTIFNSFLYVYQAGYRFQNQYDPGTPPASLLLVFLDCCWVIWDDKLWNLAPAWVITQPWMVYGLLDGYKVMSNIPKMGQLPTPVEVCFFLSLPFCFLFLPFSNDFSPKNVSGITSAQASEVIQSLRCHRIINHQLSQVGTLRCHQAQWVKSPN